MNLVSLDRASVPSLYDGLISTHATSSELRSDVLRRGRQLAADESYPPFDICERIAESLTENPFGPTLGHG
jgi:hypothetical protein